MRHYAERSLLRQAAILFAVLFCLHPLTVTAQPAAGTITGIVRSASGVLQDMGVGVYPANDESTRLDSFKTNAEGVFSFTGLAAGSYRIRFFTTGKNYIGGWYKKNVSLPSSAVETFSEGSVITLTSSVGADLEETQLDPGLTITGQVTQAAAPAIGIAGVYAQAYLNDGTTWVRTANAATTAAGDYTISGLRAGSYKVRFHAYETEYATAWYSASEEPTHTVPSAGAATLLAVAAPGASNINGQLSNGGSISGTVSKTDGTSTAPVAGALVLVYDSASPYAFRGFDITSAEAGTEGTYTVVGLPIPAGGEGSYIVQFHEKFVNNVGAGLTEWYNNASASGGATPVVITEALPAASGIDAVLDRGPISGKVSYTTTGAPVAGVTVKIAPSGGGTEKTATTDAHGLYSVPELSVHTPDNVSTTYTVQFWKNGVQIGELTLVVAGATDANLQIDPPPPSKAAPLLPIYKRLLLKKRCTTINGVRVCR